MSRLDKISYYLSYTELIPILNIPSGIVHLICAIRDSNLRHPAPAHGPETLQAMTARKLDNWTHLQKAIAILSVIGWVAMVYKFLQRDRAYTHVFRTLGGLYVPDPHRIPNTLRNDREWLLALLAHESPRFSSFAARFALVPQAIRHDRAWIDQLIERRLFQAEALQHLSPDELKDRQFILNFIDAFRNIPTDISYTLKAVDTSLKQDIEILNKLCAKLSGDYTSRDRAHHVLAYLSVEERKRVLINPNLDQRLLAGALAMNYIAFSELSPSQKASAAVVRMALEVNPKNWEHVPHDRKTDPAIVQTIRDMSMNYGQWRICVSSMATQEWVKQYKATLTNGLPEVSLDEDVWLSMISPSDAPHNCFASFYTITVKS